MSKKQVTHLIAVVSIVITLAIAAAGSTNHILQFGVVLGQETDDQAKIDVYKRFTENRTTNAAVAYQAAKDYLQKYPKDKDQYTQYLQKWVVAYERDERKSRLPQLVYTEKSYGEAFALGKQILGEEPDYLKALIDLGYAGYLASTAKNESFNGDALGYARKAIQLIEAGKAPESWAPFKSKDDGLAYLYYTVGFLNLKAAPNEAIEPLLKAVQFESDIKKTASSYYLLAAAYEAGPFAKMSADYKKNFEGKAETPESKQALAKLNEVIDRTIDAYARAVASAGNDPKNEQNKTTWKNRLTVLYKFRHEDSEAGLSELMSSVLSKPLPGP